MPAQPMVQPTAPIVSAYETARWPRIQFPGSLTAGDVDSVLVEFHLQHTAPPDKLCIDLSACRFIEIASLQMLIAYIAGRIRSGSLTTKIRLPAGAQGVNARHFLRRWEFDEAIKAATDIPLSALVDKHDLRYFSGVPGGGDEGNPYAPKTVHYTDRYGEIVLGIEAYRFFKFMSWKLDKHSDKAAIIEAERQRWSDADRVVIETLRKNVRLRSASSSVSSVGIDKLVGSRIMLQAMTNALRHPRASILQASSHMARVITQKKQPVTNELRSIQENLSTFVYWDDGQSMYDTLSAALKTDKQIRAHTEERVSYLVSRHDESDHLIDSRVILSDMTLDKQTSKEDLFIATLFPGVSCDATGRSRIRPVGDERYDAMLDKPGHGLFVLVEATTELMRGSVAFRSGDLFMSVKSIGNTPWKKNARTGEKPRYRIKIRRFPQSLPKFIGNLITVRLRSDDSQT